MKIQLDTTDKTIKVEDNVLFKELIDVLDKILPYKKWMQFTLITNVVINHWSEPVYIPRYVPVDPFPRYPWYMNSKTPLGSTSEGKPMDNNFMLKSDYKLEAGTFNIDADLKSIKEKM